MEEYLDNLIKNYDGISYEIIYDFVTGEGEVFNIIEITSNSLESDKHLHYLFHTINYYTFENEKYEYLCMVNFYSDKIKRILKETGIGGIRIE